MEKSCKIKEMYQPMLKILKVAYSGLLKRSLKRQDRINDRKNGAAGRLRHSFCIYVPYQSAKLYVSMFSKSKVTMADSKEIS